MKQKIFIIAIICLFPAILFAENRIYKLFDEEKVVNGTSTTSNSIRLLNNDGFSSQYNISGPGNLKIEYELSMGGGSWISPTGASAIDTNATNATTPDISSFSPEVSELMRIKATELGGGNVTSFDLWLGVEGD